MTPDRKTYNSAFELLREKLPPVFDIRDAHVALKTTRTFARTYCSRWASRGLVKPFGDRAGVYFNLVRDPSAETTRIKEAVDKLLDTGLHPIAIGASALHQHGWTTQRPQFHEIAIPAGDLNRTFPEIKGVAVALRPLRWFQTLLPLCSTGIDGFLTLPPEYALVDAITSSPTVFEKKRKLKLWKPDPSDIDLPSEIDPETAMKDIREAAEVLGVNEIVIADFVSEIDGLDDIPFKP